jgi:murein DD-endopeptidase MepM/ murein hydrolase activator NlpD
MAFQRRHHRILAVTVSLFALGACSDGFDFDLRSIGNGFDTSQSVQQLSAPRPQPDNRGVISYPNYQVAIARRGETVSDIAGRLGLSAVELAEFNGIPDGVPLREGETLVLTSRIAEPSPATGAIGTGPIRPAGSVDVAAVAGGAINRAGNVQQTVIPGAQTGEEPVRHRVEPGETAFSIARLYNVSPEALADWNGLGRDLSVRTGQLLLIPVVLDPPPAEVPVPPGRGSVAPEPPSASAPLPVKDATPKPAPTPAPPPAMAEARTNSAPLAMPVDGSVIRAFSAADNAGISIAASTGAPVRAAADGLVATITFDTDGVPIVVLTHDGLLSGSAKLLTVYVGATDLKVEKGNRVKRGQEIGKVAAGSPSALRFEVWEGRQGVDPMKYLN